MKKKIVVIFPTFTEAKYFNREDVSVEFCGVGVTAAAYGTLKAIHKHNPDIIIMGGIAGVYIGRAPQIGETFLVESEVEADLGFFYEDGFKHIADMNLDMDFEVNKIMTCPYIKEDMPLKKISGITLNSAMSPYIDNKLGDIESMEGGAFFYVCTKECVPFFEVRSISNSVDFGREDWDYEGSIKNLADGLNKLIDYIFID